LNTEYNFKNKAISQQATILHYFGDKITENHCYNYNVIKVAAYLKFLSTINLDVYVIST